jgi:tryptophan halogenase
MLNNINKIVIVGGGSAGWMTAAFLIKLFPEKKICLIESPNISTVGVGESTLGGINEFLIFLGLKEEDFLVKTDASYKLSIKFTDFYEKDSGSFHYPFGSPYIENSIAGGLRDWMFKKSVYPETPTEDFVKSYFPAAALFDNNKYSENIDGSFDNFNPRLCVAYHMDATKLGELLKKDYCLPKGVEHILSEVVEVPVNKNGVEKLILSNGEEITSDLFIDCTGFKSVLLGQALKEPFISFSDLIPNNRAWATKLPYKEKEKELEGFTNSTAHNNGWVWNIPLWSRLGTGYVYSDKYISPEGALLEFKEYLKSGKMVIPRKDTDIEGLEFRPIEMRIGIHERTFVKNVVAIGLAAGFIEPLESNGLFSVHTFLFSLGQALLRGRANQWSVDNYNHYTFNIFKVLGEFVSLHYSLSNRQDTEYWKDVTERSYLNRLSSPGRFSEFMTVSDAKNNIGAGLSNTSGSIYVTTGMNYPPMDSIAQKIGEIHDNLSHKDMIDKICTNLNRNQYRWLAAAKESPTLYRYLNEKFYSQFLEE